MTYKIYTTDSCGFCVASKMLLNENNIPFKEHRLLTEDQKKSFKAQGYTTVPQIWDSSGVYIGGYQQLKERLSNNNGGEQLLVE